MNRPWKIVDVGRCKQSGCQIRKHVRMGFAEYLLVYLPVYAFNRVRLALTTDFDARMRIFGLEDIEVEGVDHTDYPDFCDAFIARAFWKGTGVELTSAELDSIDSGDVYEFVYNSIY